MALVGLAFIGLLVGLIGGFILAKRAQQWCPGCGITITAAHCPRPISTKPSSAIRHPTQQEAQPRIMPSASTSMPMG
jgi:hypothetical protein